MKKLFHYRFLYYKELGDKTFIQLDDKGILWRYNEESNSIATIVKHISGNMKSRWTNFLTEDGEKVWRNRDQEFEETISTKVEMLKVWESGWTVLFNAIDQITPENLDETILIRGEKHSVMDAFLRQLAHYPYHIGQIIYIAKMLKNEDWKTLSIARNQSENYTIQKLEAQKPLEIHENSSPVCYAKSDEVRDDYKI